MRVDSWALTDFGRARKHDEDGWLIDDQLGLYAVADAMGGHAAGEVASARALRGGALQEEGGCTDQKEVRSPIKTLYES
ncbi:MAG: hypothetical protein HYV07_11850 [Deltaproteobacteria bacterium]|nr:hypothetical protein [Deltaproteobacteria bacterium]